MDKHLENYKKANNQIHLPEETKKQILNTIKETESEKQVNQINEVNTKMKKKKWFKGLGVAVAACAVLGVGIWGMYTMGGFSEKGKDTIVSNRTLEETQKVEEEATAVTYLAEPKENKLNNLYEVTDELKSDLLKNMIHFSDSSAKEVLKDKKENSCYSPVSLYVALAMCTELTGGESNTQLLQALGYDTTSDLQKDMETLTKYLNVYEGYKDDSIEQIYSKIKLANSFWVNRDSLSSGEIKKDVLTQLSDKYLAASGSCDFGNAAAGKEIGNWINKQTEGLLSPTIETNKDDLMVLINTLYFYSNWTTPFKTESTIKDTFTLENQNKTEVSYLQSSNSGSYYLDGDGYIASSIPMNAGNMIFVLPDEGITPNELLETEDLNTFLAVTDWGNSSVQTAEINYKIPKFDFNDKNDLIASAEKLGITDIFNDQADFSPLTDVKAQISKLLQESKIAIDENGCSAAAFTMAAVTKSSMITDNQEIDFSLTRPFIYIIEYQGMPLFVGTVYEP